MAFVACAMVLLFGLLFGSCRADIISDCEQKIQLVDAAISTAESAWVRGSAQIRVLKSFIDAADPAAQATKDAKAAQAGYEAQITQYESVLDDLQSKRMELNWNLSYYKKVADAKQFAIVAAQKITDYKTPYIAQVGSMVAQLKVVEDAIVAVQSIAADGALTDAKLIAASDARGRALGALTRVDGAFGSLADIDGKIGSDMDMLKQMSPDQTAPFAAWWDMQKTWVTQTKAAIAARRKYLDQLDLQMTQKKKDYDAAQALQQKLSAATADLQAKKTDALNILRGLVEVRATLIQQMSDLASAIASTLGVVDQTLAAVTRDAALADVLAQAQSVTNNMMEMGDLQRAFSSSEEVLANALASIKDFFDEKELAALRGSITQQATWMTGFASALQAMRDQSGAVRAKLDAKRTDLAASTDASAKQSAADYAASVKQFTAIITQVHNEAGSLIRDIMMPLVLGVSQKVMTLSGYFDAQSATESALAAMKNVLDQAVSDSKEIEASLKEFNLWSITLDQYADLIQKQVTDVSLKQALDSIKKNFADWKIWIKAVMDRQVSIAKTIDTAQAKYMTFAAQVKTSADGFYSLDLSSKQLVALLDVLDKITADVSNSYQNANSGLSALNALAGADAVLSQITGLITFVVTAESDLAKVQVVMADILKTFNPLSSQKTISDTYSQPIKALQDRVDGLAQKIKQARTDTDALKVQAVAKKISLSDAEKAAADKVVADKAAADKIAADKAYADKSAADKAAADKIAADKAVADKATADKAFADKLSGDRVSASQAVTASVKTVVDSVAALKAVESAFKDRFDKVKTADDLALVTKDFSTAKDQSASLAGTIAQLLAGADTLQKSLDDDKAAGRNVASDVVQSLADQRTALAAAKKDLDAVTAALPAYSTIFDRLNKDVAAKKDALAGVNAAVADASGKIQLIGGNLEKIKSAITAAQNAMASGKASAEFDTAFAGLNDAEKLKNTITNDRANVASPAYEKVKTAASRYANSFGELPASVATNISNQSAWLGALDSSLGAFMDTVGALKAQLVTKRDQIAQDDFKVLSTMTLDQQCKFLEDAVPAGQAAVIMRNLDYVVTNRKGDNARLIRFIDWVTKNRRFATAVSTLSKYRKQITG